MRFLDNIDKLYINYGKYLLKILPIYSWIYDKFELTLFLPYSKIYQICKFLRDHTGSQYKILIDICGVDFPSRGRFRFDIVYHLLSIKYNTRIRLKACVQETAFIPTIVPLFKNANWWERETYDMFGIFFKNHPDLRRILTDYGFSGHPLRKDFPLMGFVEIRYDEIKKKILTEPIELSQDFRHFKFNKAWNDPAHSQKEAVLVL